MYTHDENSKQAMTEKYSNLRNENIDLCEAVNKLIAPATIKKEAFDKKFKEVSLKVTNLVAGPIAPDLNLAIRTEPEIGETPVGQAIVELGKVNAALDKRSKELAGYLKAIDAAEKELDEKMESAEIKLVIAEEEAKRGKELKILTDAYNRAVGEYNDIVEHPHTVTINKKELNELATEAEEAKAFFKKQGKELTYVGAIAATRDAYNKDLRAMANTLVEASALYKEESTIPVPSIEEDRKNKLEKKLQELEDKRKSVESYDWVGERYKILDACRMIITEANDFIEKTQKAAEVSLHDLKPLIEENERLRGIMKGEELPPQPASTYTNLEELSSMKEKLQAAFSNQNSTKKSVEEFKSQNEQLKIKLEDLRKVTEQRLKRIEVDVDFCQRKLDGDRERIGGSLGIDENKTSQLIKVTEIPPASFLIRGKSVAETNAELNSLESQRDELSKKEKEVHEIALRLQRFFKENEKGFELLQKRASKGENFRDVAKTQLATGELSVVKINLVDDSVRKAVNSEEKYQEAIKELRVEILKRCDALTLTPSEYKDYSKMSIDDIRKALSAFAKKWSGTGGWFKKVFRFGSGGVNKEGWAAIKGAVELCKLFSGDFDTSFVNIVVVKSLLNSMFAIQSSDNLPAEVKSLPETLGNFSKYIEDTRARLLDISRVDGSVLPSKKVLVPAASSAPAASTSASSQVVAQQAVAPATLPEGPSLSLMQKQLEEMRKDAAALMTTSMGRSSLLGESVSSSVSPVVVAPATVSPPPSSSSVASFTSTLSSSTSPASERRTQLPEDFNLNRHGRSNAPSTSSGAGNLSVQSTTGAVTTALQGKDKMELIGQLTRYKDDPRNKSMFASRKYAYEVKKGYADEVIDALNRNQKIEPYSEYIGSRKKYLGFAKTTSCTNDEAKKYLLDHYSDSELAKIVAKAISMQNALPVVGDTSKQGADVGSSKKNAAEGVSMNSGSSGVTVNVDRDNNFRAGTNVTHT